MFSIIFGCYNCYYIITGGCISIRMVLLTVRPKYRSENNLSILGGCCSDCAGWGKRSLLGKQCLRAVSLHWIWQEKINRTSLWRKEARAADGDDDKKAENCSTHLCVSLTIKATSQLNDSPTQLKNIITPNFGSSTYFIDSRSTRSSFSLVLFNSLEFDATLMWCISLMVYDIYMFYDLNIMSYI